MEFDDDLSESNSKVRSVATPLAVAHNLNIEAWQEAFNDKTIYFQVYLLKDSYFIWIGSNPASMNNLNVALMTSYQPSASVTTILGHQMEGGGRNIASRLAKRLKKPIYLSFSPETEAPMLEEWCEKRLVDRIATLASSSSSPSI